MPISSRRYLSAYEYVIKYLRFAEKNADSHKLRRVNPKYLTTAEPSGISFEISSFRNSHSLPQACIESFKEPGTLKKRVDFSEVTGGRAPSFSNLSMGGESQILTSRIGIWMSFFCIRTRKFALSLLFPYDPVPRLSPKETSIFPLFGSFCVAARGT